MSNINPIGKKMLSSDLKTKILSQIMKVNNAFYLIFNLKSHRFSQKNRLHSLSMGMPFIAQVMDGFGVPLALQVSTPFSPGARTRFRGAPPIQYGAAENRGGSSRRLEN